MNTNNKFSSRGHILASVGAAVGIANLVLFPARVFNYGGLAFILVFILCTFLMGVPLMIAETALGKNGQSDAVRAFSRIGGKKWRWAGIFGLVTCSFILSFYIIVAGWALYYLFIYVFQYQEISLSVANILEQGKPSIAAIGGIFGRFVTSTYEVILFSGIFMGLTVFIVAHDIKQGIEWVSKRFVPLLVFLIFCLIITIPLIDNVDLNYDNFSFDFSSLFSIDSSGRIGIIEAVGQAFFSLSIGACSMVTYGSHINKNTNVVSNSHYIVHIDTLVALLGAILIIPLFSASDKVGLDPTLVFISLVDTFNSFGEPWGRIIGICFFTLFNFAILTSTISLLEPVVNFLSKNQNNKRKGLSITIGLLVFLMSIPGILSFNPDSPSFFTNFLGYGNQSDRTMGYFNFILDFFGTFCLLVGAFILAIFIRRKWSIEGLINEITVSSYQPSKSLEVFLKVSFRWIIPVLMLLLFVGECIKVIHKFN